MARGTGTIVTVANLKGGCGKSTIALNLACALVEAKHDVHMVDADEQGTVSGALKGGGFPVSGEALLLKSIRGADSWAERVRELARAHDFLLIDCPPHLAAATQAAIEVADIVLVPVTPSLADLTATANALELVVEAQKRRRGKPACLLVPSKVDRRTAAGQALSKMLKDFGESVAPDVRQLTAFVESYWRGQWVGEYAPNSPAHDDMKALARRVTRAAKAA
ncbi:MAG: ParA family protein [Alphaproteobacteria bacterium]